MRSDGWPHVTQVNYLRLDHALYFVLSRDSQKFANIDRDPRVSIALGGSQSPRGLSIAATISRYQPAFGELAAVLDQVVDASESAELQAQIEATIGQGVPAALARQVGLLSTLFPALDIAELAAQAQQSVASIARLYFMLGARLELHWLLAQIASQPVLNHWQAMARAASREELDWQQRSLTQAILQEVTAVDDAEAVGLLQRVGGLRHHVDDLGEGERAPCSITPMPNPSWL